MLLEYGNEYSFNQEKLQEKFVYNNIPEIHSEGW